MDLTEMLKYAKRVAFRMWHDPEAESLAGLAAWRAFRTFDPSRGVPPKRWVALVVKREVWGEWRKQKVRREEQKGLAWFEDAAQSFDDELNETETPMLDWLILVEKHIQGWPYDVIAKRHDMTEYVIRKMLRAAESRFLSTMVGEPEL